MIVPPAALPASIALVRPIAQRVGQAPAAEIWQVDQLRLSPDTPGATLEALGPDHSLAAVIARLKSMGVPFTHGRAGLLPDRIPADVRAQIDHLPPGEPFVIPGRDYISVNVIIGRILPPGTVRYVPSPRAALQRMS